MPLMVMSPNIAEMNSPTRKRSHEEYSGDISDVLVKSEPQVHMKMEPSDMEGTSIPSHLSRQSPPVQSSPAALTEAGSSTPGGASTSPNTPTRQPLLPVDLAPQNSVDTSQPPTFSPAKTALPSAQGPPAKKKKLTPGEKQAKQAEDAAKKAERDKKKQESEAQKQAEKEKRQAEREKKHAETEARKKEREQKRQDAEQREREKKEEAERKARAQTRIGAFFKKDSTTPKKALSTVADIPVKARSPSPAAAQTEYEKLAIPFFVHKNVALAKNPFAVDDETQETTASIITDYLAGKRSPVQTKQFDPVSTLHLVGPPLPRGKQFPRVRDIMSDQDGGTSNPINLIAEQSKLSTRSCLKSVPMKQFSFHEDVRPGYYGTVTSVHSVAALRKMARRPTTKDLPLNYDYDSEAEWVQGDEEEDAEGIDDMTDDEDEEDDDKSMDGFLDDSEDVRRGPLLVSSMEPESSGICYEDRNRRNPNPQMYKFRMEFIIPDLEHHHSIDPFSNAYWPSDTKTVTTTNPGQVAKPKAAKAQTIEVTSDGIMPPPPAPKASAATTSKSAPAAADLIPAELLDEFKAVILEFKFLPKTALIPTLLHKFDKCKKAQIAATLEHVAEKPKKKGDWQLKPDV